MIDRLSIFALAAQCALAAPADITASVALVESGGEPFAVKINSEPINSSSLEEGIATIMEAVAEGQHVTFGLGMISKQNADDAGIGIKDGLSPCRNLKVLGDVLAQKYQEAEGTGDARWLQAAALFGTGVDSGEIAAAYIASVQGILTNFGGVTTNSASTRQAEPRGRVVAPTPTPRTEPSSPKWDVFSSSKNHPLLVYQGTRK